MRLIGSSSGGGGGGGTGVNKVVTIVDSMFNDPVGQYGVLQPQNATALPAYEGMFVGTNITDLNSNNEFGVDPQTGRTFRHGTNAVLNNEAWFDLPADSRPQFRAQNRCILAAKMEFNSVSNLRYYFGFFLTGMGAFDTAILVPANPLEVYTGIHIDTGLDPAFRAVKNHDGLGGSRAFSTIATLSPDTTYYLIVDLTSVSATYSILDGDRAVVGTTSFTSDLIPQASNLVARCGGKTLAAEDKRFRYAKIIGANRI